MMNSTAAAFWSGARSVPLPLGTTSRDPNAPVSIADPFDRAEALVAHQR